MISVRFLLSTAGLSALLVASQASALAAPFFNGQIPGIPAFAPSLSNNTYDYIVVGAGTGGLTLASRLSESGAKVAVVEAGIDQDFSIINGVFSATPGADVVGVGSDTGDNLNNGIDWQFVTAPQAGANNRKVRYARGKCAGGSSARNFMIYQRPTVGSMLSWQYLTGDSSWGFNERKADFMKSMTFTPPKANLRQEMPAAQYDASDFGSSSSTIAPLSVSYPNTPQNFSKFMQLSANELGVRTVKSFNGGKLMGVQYNSATLVAQGGYRSTSRAFFAAAQSRPNFNLYFQTYAKQVLFKTVNGAEKAVGVAISTNDGGQGTTDVLYATREVIVSAGAFQSPQLLMVSGIGPKAQLAKYNIKPIAINENVGQGMQDHIFFGPTYPVDPSTITFTKLAADPVFLAAQLANFTLNQLGPLTNHVADLLSWERPSDAQLSSIGASKLSLYPADWPLLEGFSAPGVVGNFANLLAENLAAGLGGKEFATILFALVAPQSRGTITLASADMADAPIIDPRWLTDPVDQALAIYAFKRARQYFAANAMKPILAGIEYLPGPAVQTDAQILAWIQNNLMTVWHASCTTSMRTKENGGVLDNRLRVYDVTGLRVVDAASFPNLPPGHPQSTIYMLAERAATLIMQDNA